MKTHPYSRSGRTQMAVCLIAGMLLALNTRAQMPPPPVPVYFDTRDTVHYKIESSSGDLCGSSFYFFFDDLFEKNPWVAAPNRNSYVSCYRTFSECLDHRYRLEDIPPDSIKDRTWLYSAWLEDEKKAELLRKQKKWSFFGRAYFRIILVLLPSHKLIRADSNAPFRVRCRY